VKRFLIVASAFALVSTALIWNAAFAGDPGSSQFDALPITGQTQFIQPQTQLWFYFDYNTDRDKNKSRIEVWVDDNLSQDTLKKTIASNVELFIYTQAQANDYIRDSSIQPIGKGSQPGTSSNVSGHDLYWAGRFNSNGRYYVVVKNSNTIPIEFRLYAQGMTLTLFPVPTPTPLYPFLDNPLATPIPTAAISGTLVFREHSGGIIYTVDGDGSTPKQIVSNGLDPAWSPDGTQIVFTRWDQPYGMYLVNADGSNPVRIWNGQKFMSPRWSPDGKLIAFSQFKKTRVGGVSCASNRSFAGAQDDIWDLGVLQLNKQIDAETFRNALTEPPCTGHCFSPTWSADGRYLAYADAACGLMNTDTMSNTIWTMYNYTIKVQSPMYSPDGTKVVFQYSLHDHWEINLLNLMDGSVKPLTSPDPLAFRIVNNVSPVWSPDGSQVLFLSDRHSKWEFYVVNVDGTGLRQVLQTVTNVIPIQYYFSNERVIDWKK
jgi:Tol biopolymer transport system component